MTPSQRLAGTSDVTITRSCSGSDRRQAPAGRAGGDTPAWTDPGRRSYETSGIECGSPGDHAQEGSPLQRCTPSCPCTATGRRAGNPPTEQCPSSRWSRRSPRSRRSAGPNGSEQVDVAGSGVTYGPFSRPSARTANRHRLRGRPAGAVLNAPCPRHHSTRARASVGARRVTLPHRSARPHRTDLGEGGRPRTAPGRASRSAAQGHDWRAGAPTLRRVRAQARRTWRSAGDQQEPACSSRQSAGPRSPRRPRARAVHRE